MFRPHFDGFLSLGEFFFENASGHLTGKPNTQATLTRKFYSHQVWGAMVASSFRSPMSLFVPTFLCGVPALWIISDLTPTDQTKPPMRPTRPRE